MEDHKHYRGNGRGLIEIDDGYCFDTDLVFSDSKKNGIWGRDILAAHLIANAHLENNIYRRDKILDDIIYLYSTADKILMNDMNHLLGRAYVSLLEDEPLKDANELFISLLTESLFCIPFKLGRSPIELAEAECKRALIEYSRNLRNRNEKTHQIRAKMSFCLLSLGNIDKAEFEFKLVLRSDSKCALALIGLAIIKLMNSPINTLNLCINFSKKLTVDTVKPETLNKIASYYYYMEEYDIAIEYSKLIVNRSRSVDRIIDSFHLLGKIYENQCNYDCAFEYYYKAVTLNPYIPGPSHFGLGKMYVLNCAFEKAIQSWEFYLRDNPKCKKTKKMLSTLYAQLGGETYTPMSKKILEEMENECPNDLTACVGLAIHSYKDYPTFKRYYYKISYLMSESGLSECSVELLNDIAYIHCQFENYEEACLILEACVNHLKEVTNNTMGNLYLKFLLQSSSVRLAEVYARQEKFHKAEVLYTETLKNDPNDIDVITSLGNLAALHNQDNLAREYAEKALQINPKSSKAFKLLQELNLKTGMKVPFIPSTGMKVPFIPSTGMKEMNVYKESPVTDSVKVSIVKTDIELEVMKDFSAVEDNDFDSLGLKLANELLKGDPEYIWKTNGIGHDLSLKTPVLSKLKNVFATAENSDKLCRAWIFYAESCIKNKLSSQSIEVLEVCTKLFFIHDHVSAYQLLGYEYATTGRVIEGKRILTKAIMMNPSCNSIMNNFAFAIQQIGHEMLHTQVNVSGVHRAITLIKLAMKYFTFLLNQKDISVHYAAKEGLLTSQQKVTLFPFFEHRARIQEMEFSKPLQINEKKIKLKKNLSKRLISKHQNK